MSELRIVLIGLLLTTAVSGGRAAVAQPLPPDELPPPRTTEVPSDGFFPTPRMIDHAIDRMTEELSQQYELDDEQLAYLRDVLKERVPPWLQENKAEIKTLTNRYFEALLSGEPPEVDDVAAWSQRVLPLVGELQEVVGSSMDEFRTVLTDEQASILDGNMAAFNVGMSFVGSKLQLWADGGYDPEVDWPRGERYHEMEAAEQQALAEAQARAEAEARGEEYAPPLHAGAAASAVESGPTSQPTASQPALASAPVDAWDAYAEDFIARYALDDDQAAKARQFARQAKEQRDRYQARKIDAFRKIEAELTAPGDKNAGELQQQYERLKAPIERMFEQLQDRLDRLPTNSQRRSALARDRATVKDEASSANP